ncbi:MAG: alpha/beta hydrolase [Bacteroidetes bacterium]|nr:alpha/beta hydrolase [Bacteroidota bacterium]
MRFTLIISLLFCITNTYSFAQTSKTRVYLFPGQGSDARIFSEIVLDSTFERIPVTYPVPEKGMSLPEYARLIGPSIDTTRPYIFIGVSLGGMICTELAETMHPQRVIIISSAKCRSELPVRYRFQHHVKINRLVPPRLVKGGARILQPVVEPDRRHRARTFRQMLRAKNPLYLKRTVDMIVNWQRTTADSSIIHIHGSNDHTLPIRHTRADYVIEGGSHMMTLTRGKELNALLLDILRSSQAAR